MSYIKVEPKPMRLAGVAFARSQWWRLMRENYIEVWDSFVRVDHWTVVTAFTIAYLTGEDFLSTHVWSGYVVGTVVALRVAWGFIGPRRARFVDFIYGPSAISTYLLDMIRFRAKRYVGHSPAGGAMVMALLGCLGGTVITGLAVYAAKERAGPLAPFYVATGTSSALTAKAAGGSGEIENDRAAGRENSGDEGLEELHEAFANITQVLIVLHVPGVTLASIVHRENLVVAMITGRKRADDPDSKPRRTLGQNKTESARTVRRP